MTWYLRIPSHVVYDFTFAHFCDHVLDHSPVFASRALLRLGMKARDAIAEAKDGVAALSDEVGEVWREACEHAPTPRRWLQPPKGIEGVPPQPVGATAYEPFYAAVESMTREPPAVETATPNPA
jgi:hypothetical protein